MHDDLQEDIPGTSDKIVVRPYQTLQGHNDSVLRASFSQEGHLIVSHDFGTIHVWKRDHQHHYVSHRVIETENETTFVAVSQDGSLIASIYEHRIFGIKVRLWTSDGAWITDLSHHGGALAVIFTPDTRHLVVIDTVGVLTLWDVTTFALLCTSEPPPNGTKTGFSPKISYVAFAPDGQRLAVAWFTSNGAVQIYCIEEILDEGEIQYNIRWSGAVAPEMLPKSSLVKGLCYSPDWQYLAVASDRDCVVWVFDAFSLRLVTSFELPRTLAGIADIVYSPDGTYFALAHADGTVWIWEVENQDPAPILVFTAHPTEIAGYSTVIGSIDWSPNNKLIMTTGVGRYEYPDSKTGVFEKMDNTVKLWKIQKNQSV